MSQTLLLTVGNYEFDAGSNTTNPLGFMIRIAAEHEGGDEELRIYFTLPGAPEGPDIVGWRASDGGLAIFLPRKDYLAYVTLLEQVSADDIRIALDDRDNITSFDISSAPFTNDAKAGKLRETDAAEFAKRQKKS